MTLARYMILPVVITLPGSATDQWDNPVDDWDAATSTATTGWLAQNTTDEPAALGRSESLTFDAVLMLEPDEQINAKARVTVDGDAYEVAGRPTLARTPRGLHHIEVPLRSATG